VAKLLFVADDDTLLRGNWHFASVGWQPEELHSASDIAVVPEMPTGVDLELHERNFEGVEREGLVVFVDDELKPFLSESQILNKLFVDELNTSQMALDALVLVWIESRQHIIVGLQVEQVKVLVDVLLLLQLVGHLPFNIAVCRHIVKGSVVPSLEFF
jgi:hypothetical protein